MERARTALLTTTGVENDVIKAGNILFADILPTMRALDREHAVAGMSALDPDFSSQIGAGCEPPRLPAYESPLLSDLNARDTSRLAGCQFSDLQGQITMELEGSATFPSVIAVAETDSDRERAAQIDVVLGTWRKKLIRALARKLEKLDQLIEMDIVRFVIVNI